jgi:hypothetical protein
MSTGTSSGWSSTIPPEDRAPRTTITAGRKAHATVLRCGRDSAFSPSGSITLEFDWNDADRARHILRDLVAEVEGHLAEILEKTGVQ